VNISAFSSSSSENRDQLFATEDEYLYMLGLQSSSNYSDSNQVILRAKARQLINFDFHDVQILSTNSSHRNGMDWNRLKMTASSNQLLLQPFSIFSPSVTESSLHFDKFLDRWVVVFLYAMNPTMRICRSASSSIASMWHCTHLAKIDPNWSRMYILFTYAGRAHPALMMPSSASSLASPIINISENSTVVTTKVDQNSFQMVVSFIPNTLYGDEEIYEEDFFNIYTPKFLLISESIPAKLIN